MDSRNLLRSCISCCNRAPESLAAAAAASAAWAAARAAAASAAAASAAAAATSAAAAATVNPIPADAFDDGSTLGSSAFRRFHRKELPLCSPVALFFSVPCLPESFAVLNHGQLCSNIKFHEKLFMFHVTLLCRWTSRCWHQTTRKSSVGDKTVLLLKEFGTWCFMQFCIYWCFIF
jgi:hypothetical protein